MTAEIAVANKLGIAIAADSAVTVEQFHKNKLVTKVYNSANKIFTLSKWHPIGAMIYNTTTLGGTPWEIIIKDYRAKLGRNFHDTVEEYAADFFRHLQQSKFLFPDDTVKEIVFFNIYRIISALKDRSSSAAEFKAKLTEEISRLEQVEYVDGFDAAFETTLIKTYRQEVGQASSYALKPAYRNGSSKQILRLVQLALSRQERLSGYSGLVICGYGNNEIFPRLIEFYCDIVVCGRVRAWRLNSESIRRDKPSFVLPFADTTMVRTIIDGINPSYKTKQIQESIRVISSMPAEILQQVTQLTQAEKDAYAGAAQKSVVDAFIDFMRSMNTFREEEYVNPIEQTIGLLPLSELANVAETFLSASHIQKRVTPALESVGGPVDVAVISKGDGFIWIKRKHYFSTNLNQGFVSKYLDSVSD